MTAHETIGLSLITIGYGWLLSHAKYKFNIEIIFWIILIAGIILI